MRSSLPGIQQLLCAGACLSLLAASGMAQMVEGLPFETRPPEKVDDKPLFPQQTRAPYHKVADYTVTTITNKLHLPWCLAFLPDGKFLITEKENPSALRIVDQDGTLSAPISGLTMLAAPGKLGLLDVALDPNFARTKRVFFTFFERLEDGYSNTNVAHAVLDETAGALHDVTVIFRAMPAAPVKNFSLKQGGRIAFAQDGTLFLTIGDRDQGTPWMGVASFLLPKMTVETPTISREFLTRRA